MQHEQRDNPDGATQTRAHDSQNRMTSVSGQSAPTYDANGNLLTDGASTYEYDAWNRLARAKVSNKWFAYEHDALGRRIVEGSNPGNSSLDDRPTDVELYYNASWQVVQEKNVRGDGLGNTYDTTVSNVWSPAYIDALVLRDTTVVVTEGGLGGGGFGGQMIGGGGEVGQMSIDPGVQRPLPPAGRVYVQQDANFNATAITDSSGNVLERYVYDPYGRSDVLTASWTFKTGTAAFQGNYAFTQRFQGLRLDLITTNHNARNRDLNSRLGVWNTQDPIGYPDGTNRYLVERNDPVGSLDPLGLKVKPDGPYATYDDDGRPVWRTHYYDEGWFSTTYNGFTDEQRFEGDLGNPDPDAPGSGMDQGNIYDKDLDLICRGRSAFVAAATEAGQNAGGATGLGPTGDGLLMAGALPVVFKVGHIMRHFKGTGITQEALEAAIKADLPTRTCKPGFNEFEITVGGKPVVYLPYQLPDGTINVGTAFPK